MINVKFINAETFVSIECNGHSGYAESGKDIICSAASTLMFTFAETISETFCKNNQPYIEQKNGYMLVRQAKQKCKNAKIETIYNTIKTGFRLLNAAYPEFINLTFES